MKALTIDDDPDFLNILETHLKGVGYSTRAISTPSDILNAINEDKYDLVLVDWMMPEVDGITVIKAIRSRDRYLGHRTRVIMVTAINNALARSYAQQIGADGFLPKSESPETFGVQLMNTIRTVMNTPVGA
jgi:DNA-binding response OmpR family regulator